MAIEAKPQGLEEGVELIGVEFSDFFHNPLPSNRRQAIEGVYLALQFLLARILARRHVDPFARKRLYDRLVGAVDKIEFVRPKLGQRSFGEDARKHRTQERVTVLVGLRQRHDCSLNLLGLVPGVLRVPTPSGLDKGSRTAQRFL